MSDVTITRHGNAKAGEYRAHVNGSDDIGRLTWVERSGARVAEHTFVPPSIGRRGIAAQLVEAFVKDAREQNFKINPVCSYVVAKFDKYPHWSNIRA